MEIKIIQGDITELDVDVIVNAANSTLRGGGGVDGAIHRKAGPLLLQECITLNHCATGDAKITEGYNLKARKIVHTVGPVWHNGEKNEKHDLEQAYKNSLALADSHNAETIAFPCISTGIYKFPPELAAQIAVNTVREFEAKNLKEVMFCCFLDSDVKIYNDLMNPTSMNTATP